MKSEHQTFCGRQYGGQLPEGKHTGAGAQVGGE